MKEWWKKNGFRLAARYAGGLSLFSAGAFVSNAGANVLSMLLFFFLGVLEIVLLYSETRRILDLRILLTASWCFSLAITVLKLTFHGKPFGVSTWTSIGGFYFAFLFAFDLMTALSRAFPFRERDRKTPREISGNRLFLSILLIAGLSFAGLVAEAVVFGFEFPIFASDTPHAYTAFHLSGVHYFVVSAVLVPPLTVLYLHREKPRKGKAVLLVAANVYAVLSPVLLLSKLNLMLTFVLPLLTFFLVSGRMNRRNRVLLTAGFFVVSAAAFFVLVARRQYPEGYLQEIFQFKNERMPVWLQYPYVYITNNFENLNLFIEAGEAPTFGLRSLFPFFALTGLKFLPAVGSLYLFTLTKHLAIEELTTHTVIYDVYGDFQGAGVIIFGMILGLAAFFLCRALEKRKTPFTVLLYAEMAVYFSLSFFDVWFSQPAVWFWFILTAAVGFFTGRKVKNYG